jgi:hypothetical protein
MLVGSVPELEVARGRIERAEWALAFAARLQHSADVQDRASYAAAKATVLRAVGRHAEALAAAEEAIAMVDILGWGSQVAKQGLVEAIEAALALGELERAETLVALIEDRPRGAAPLYLRAHAARFRARLSTGSEVEPRLKSAAATFRELGLPFWTAVAELELAEWLVAHGRGHEAAPLLAGARETFERLEATPWPSAPTGRRRAEPTSSPQAPEAGVLTAETRLVAPSDTRRALALAANAERGVCRARPRLGIRRGRRTAGAPRGGRSPARGAWFCGRERDGAAQARRR